MKEQKENQLTCRFIEDEMFNELIRIANKLKMKPEDLLFLGGKAIIRSYKDNGYIAVPTV